MILPLQLLCGTLTCQMHLLMTMICNLVANLEDILSERGACGVGFIANLDNKASHGIVSDALTALGCMEHRGGCGADNDFGDGSGLMTSIPWDLFNTWASEQGTGAFDPVHTGVGMIFLPKEADLMKQAQAGGTDGGDIAEEGRGQASQRR